MRIKPCHGCPFRDGCDLRDEFRRRARGVGASSITFRCDRLRDLLTPGTRVVITAPALCTGYHYDGSEYEGIAHYAVEATVTHNDGRGRFACVVDPGALSDESGEPQDDKFRFRKLAPISRIKRILDEPPLPICEAGNVVRDGKCDISHGECWCPSSPYGQQLAAETAAALAEAERWL